MLDLDLKPGQLFQLELYRRELADGRLTRAELNALIIDLAQQTMQLRSAFAQLVKEKGL